jgi:glycoside/pentoside/hexuronide:cation symporter, GPH family
LAAAVGPPRTPGAHVNSAFGIERVCFVHRRSRRKHKNKTLPTQVRAASNHKIRIAFTLASLTHSAGQNVVTLLAFRYFTDNLAMAAATVGLLFAAVKIYDGILDPMLGAVSDQTRTVLGRRLPYLLGGSILMPAAIVLLFAAPASLSAASLWIFVALVMIVHATAYTALTIPGMAMVVEITDDFHERSTLMSYRVIGNTIGTLAGSTLPAWLLARWGSSREGHIDVSWVVAGIVMLAGLTSVGLLRGSVRSTQVENPPRMRFANLSQQLRLAWNNYPFRLLATAHIFVLIGTATTSISNAYFTRYILKRSDNWLGNYYLFATIGVVASMPLWLKVAQTTGKKQCYIASMLGFGLLHLTWFFVGQSEPYALLVARALLVGVASAGMILFAYSMLSDAIRYDYIQTGLRREGSFAGFTSLIDKVAAAAGIAGLGLLMTAMGYVQSTSGGQTPQSDHAIMAIYIGFTIVPAVCMVCGVLAIWNYKLEADDLLESKRQ